MKNINELVTISIEHSGKIDDRYDRKFIVDIKIGNGVKEEELIKLRRHAKGIAKIFNDYAKRI